MIGIPLFNLIKTELFVQVLCRIIINSGFDHELLMIIIFKCEFYQFLPYPFSEEPGMHDQALNMNKFLMFPDFHDTGKLLPFCKPKKCSIGSNVFFKWPFQGWKIGSL